MRSKDVTKMACWFALALVALAGCGTRSVTTKVERAPWISFKGKRTIALELPNYRCLEGQLGPEFEWKVLEHTVGEGLLGGESIRKQNMLKERWTACDSDFAVRMRSALRTQMEARLSEAGYQVVDSGANDVLRVTATVRRAIQIDRAGGKPKLEEYKPAENPCPESCGKPACYWWDHKAYIEIEFSAHSDEAKPGAKPDVYRNGGALAGSGGRYAQIAQNIGPEYTCTVEDAHEMFDRSRYDWEHAEDRALVWSEQVFGYMLMPYVEDYELRLYDVKELADGAAGLQAAEMKQWDVAAEAFKRASEAQAKSQPTELEARAQVLYNLAAMLMQTGALEKARQVLAESSALKELRYTPDLDREVQRRIADTGRM